MMQSPLKPDMILPAQASLGEGPLWDVQQQCLYWVDINQHQVYRFDPATRTQKHWDVGDVVGCVVLTQSDRLLMAQRNGLTLLDTTTGKIEPICAIEADLPNNRFNDGKCDPKGRFWFGSLSSDRGAANLYRYDPDGSLHQMETGLTISNGLGWSPDQRTFYLTDSAAGIIYAYEFEIETGQLGDRHILVNFSQESYCPDGLTIDQQGCLWSALWDGNSVIQFDPQGQELQQISLPILRPTSCVFGGTDLTTIYITSATCDTGQPHSPSDGNIFAVSTQIAGLPSDRFGAL